MSSGNNVYCPGGIDAQTLERVRANMYEMMSSVDKLGLYEVSCVVCECPLHSSTHTRFSSSIRNCIVERGFFMDRDTGKVEGCDPAPYNSPLITVYPEFGGFCARQCVTPDATKNTDGRCRCDLDAGYVIDEAAGRCRLVNFVDTCTCYVCD